MNSEQYNLQEQMAADKIDVNISELFRMNKKEPMRTLSWRGIGHIKLKSLLKRSAYSLYTWYVSLLVLKSFTS